MKQSHQSSLVGWRLAMVAGSVTLAAIGALAACRGSGGSGGSQRDADLGALPEPLYVGSYVRVPVQLQGGKKLEEFEFLVAEGPQGGVVSESKDQTFSEKRPDIILIAGYAPGAYTLVARNRATGDVVDKEPFKVTAQAAHVRHGPSLVVHGIDELRAGSAWGGGGAGPQNVNLHPALGTRRIAVLFVDTSEQRYSTTPGVFDALRDHWRDALINGINVGGVDFSLRRYYQEAARGLFDVTAQFFGPFAMAGDWATDGGAAGFGAHIQAAITAADTAVDYNNFDTILVVSQSVIGATRPDDKFAWPTASIGEWGGWVTAEGTLTLGVIQMPHDWDVRDARAIWETASHEFGHNLGMSDQYAPTVGTRNVGAWDLMDADGAFPELSLAHKLRLGWVDPAWVVPFDFASLGTPVDQMVTIAPVSAGAPPAGRFVGAEVRLTDGWNYYFEYRSDDAARIADRELPNNDRVLGTDVVSGSYVAPITRPGLLLLSSDTDGDGPVLANGQDYRETDNTDPVYPVDFDVDVNGIDGSKADLHVRYGVNGKPDPSIQPWGAPPWQTPAIEVRNTRNATDPAWFNVPWQSHNNDVVAKVKNNGTLDAPDVTVNFYVKDYNVGGTPETFLGSDRRSIAPGATVEFQTNWNPPAAGHFCIIVRIPLYLRPGVPVVAEMTELNNVAQSNYDRFISPTASPAERRLTEIAVGNPYPRATRVYLDVQQTNPLYRTYLEHRWVDLAANETIKVGVMLEYVGAARVGWRSDVDVRRFAQVQNEVSLAANIVDPTDPHGHRFENLGGAGVSVATGKATRIEKFEAVDGTVRGRVVTSDGKPVAGGIVIVTMGEQKGGKGGLTDVTLKLADGAFSAPARFKDGTASAYFVPPPGYGDATSETITIRN